MSSIIYYYIQTIKASKQYSLATLLLCLLFVKSSNPLFAQDSASAIEPDSLIILEKNAEPIVSDTVAIISYAKRFDPQKALLYAAILPGAGQVYNKKYWKVPLVYGGFAFLGYYINLYNDNYRKYRSELFTVVNTTNLSASNLNETQLRSVIDRYRRERDLFIVFTGLWYALQIIDAHVDSHLKEFDLNPNLQVRVEPTFKQDAFMGRQTGFSISIRF